MSMSDVLLAYRTSYSNAFVLSFVSAHHMMVMKMRVLLEFTKRSAQMGIMHQLKLMG